MCRVSETERRGRVHTAVRHTEGKRDMEGHRKVGREEERGDIYMERERGMERDIEGCEIGR